MPDELLERLRRFHNDAFPQYQAQFRELVDQGQNPGTLFIGCPDSRLVPHLLTGTGPGELFRVRNVGAFVPPWTGRPEAPQSGGVTDEGRWFGRHGTAAAIEYAVLSLAVKHVVVCGHTHCGAIRALWGGVPDEAVNLAHWLELSRGAVLPVVPGDEAIRRTEQRSIVLQLERLMDYPMVRRKVEAHALALHGWHYVIEEGEVHVFDIKTGGFVPASRAENAGTGPYQPAAEEGLLFSEMDASLAPKRT